MNPVWRVGFQIREALRANNISNRQGAGLASVRLLADVGMPDPDVRAKRYPHQLSGGMCQRALIAIGLAGRPRLLVADEPTSALDVTVQRQVLDHLQGLAAELGTAVLLITHDLALAGERAGHIMVMYRGSVVESGTAQQVLTDPQHNYTKTLVASAPALARRVVPVAAVVEHPGPPIADPPDLVVAHRPDQGVQEVHRGRPGVVSAQAVQHGGGRG